MDWPAWVTALSAFITAIFTGLLFVATYRLWNSTKGLHDETKRLAGLAETQSKDMKDSIAAAQTAANAAKKSADVTERALNDLESPFLYPVELGELIRDGFRDYKKSEYVDKPGTGVCPIVSFKIKNYGRALALLKSVAVQVEHWTEMVPEPRVNYLAQGAGEPVLEPNGVSGSYRTGMLNPIDFIGIESIEVRKSHIFFYGEIEFSDLLGNDYVQTFCLVWHPQIGRFIPWRPKYNQRKRKDCAKS